CRFVDLFGSPRVLVALLLPLVQLVVERLENDPQLGRGRRLVAVVLLQHAQDVLHLNLAQGPRGGGRGRGARGGGQRALPAERGGAGGGAGAPGVREGRGRGLPPPRRGGGVLPPRCQLPRPWP